MSNLENRGNTNEKDINRPKPFTFWMYDHHSKLTEGLCKQRDEGRFLDCVIETSSSSIEVHKSVIALCCEYFDTLLRFEEQHQQQQDSKKRIIKLTHLDPKSVKALIEFAYSGRITVDYDDVFDLLQAADYLCVTRVSEACWNYLQKSISADNWFSILECARSLHNMKLINDTKEYILKNFSQVSACSDFLCLDKDTLNDVLNDNKLTIVEKYEYESSSRSFFVPPSRQEDLLLQSVLRYVEHNPSERLELLPRILSQGVRLPLISPSVLLTYMPHHLIADSFRCTAILKKAIELNSFDTYRVPISDTHNLDDDVELGIGLLFKSAGGLVCDSQDSESSSSPSITPDQVMEVSCSSNDEINSNDELVPNSNDALSKNIKVGLYEGKVSSLGQGVLNHISEQWTNPRDLSNITHYSSALATHTTVKLKLDNCHLVSFDDLELGIPVQYITGMKMCMKTFEDGSQSIAGICVTYNHIHSVLHGTIDCSDEVYEFTTTPDERITCVDVVNILMIKSLKFTTSKGAVYGPFGCTSSLESTLNRLGLVAPCTSGYLSHVSGTVDIIENSPVVRNLQFTWAYSKWDETFNGIDDDNDDDDDYEPDYYDNYDEHDDDDDYDDEDDEAVINFYLGL